MRLPWPVIATFFVLSIGLIGCEAVPTESTTGGTVTIQGQFVDALTDEPIPSAVIRKIAPKPEQSVQSDENGNFTFQVEVDSTISLTLMMYREGYENDTTTVLAVPDRDINLPLLRLHPLESSLTTIRGQVISAQDSTPVFNASVRIISPEPERTTTTDALGKYVFQVQTESTTRFVLLASKDDLVSDSLAINVTPESEVTLPDLHLREIQGYREPASIILKSISATTIPVQSSGDLEITNLVFEVQDSVGRPIAAQQSVGVDFLFGAAPDGGEALYPKSAFSDENGQVATSVVSGTIAGVVQVLAQFQRNGTTVRSRPVRLTIQGGLPDSAHFTVTPEKVNFPGAHIAGETLEIFAQVGDKYGNIVPVGTAVYFTTDGGIIDGEALTDESGRAAVNLISGNPFPEHPLLGHGFATIRARTGDENQNTIETTATVLFSGKPIISNVSIDTFHYQQGQSQNVTYTVSDQYDNPLGEGTNISVTAEPGNLEFFGDTDVTLGDTQQRGDNFTQFNFIVTNADTSGNPQLEPAVIEISVDGPNGAVEHKIHGTIE